MRSGCLVSIRRVRLTNSSSPHQHLHISVQPATSTISVLTWAKAKMVVVPPPTEPTSRLVIESLLWISVTCKAYRLPSNETFDQGYCEKRLKLLSFPAFSVVRRVRPEPSVFSFHNPF